MWLKWYAFIGYSNYYFTYSTHLLLELYEICVYKYTFILHSHNYFSYIYG